MDFKAVMFDLDGTLINSIHDLGDSVNKVLAKRGYKTHEIDKYYRFVGNGMGKLVERALPENFPLDGVYEEIVSEVMEEYQQSWNKKTCLYQDIDKLLDFLEGKVDLGILSNKPHEFTVKVGEYFFSQWDFKIVQGAMAGKPHKPDPTLALEVAEKMGYTPKEIIYVGDSDVDIKTAINAGFYPVGVSWGFRGAKELWDNGAKKVLNNPLELLDLLSTRR